MLHKRTACALVSCDNYIYAIGGRSSHDSIEDSVERYDVQKNQWEQVAPLPFARQSACAACFDKYIYVFGGTKYTPDQVEYLNNVECYDVVQNKWSTVGQLHSKLSHAAVVVV
jgi:N-acetylneuraminic acid mutarotase